MNRCKVRGLVPAVFIATSRIPRRLTLDDGGVPWTIEEHCGGQRGGYQGARNRVAPSYLVIVVEPMAGSAIAVVQERYC